MDRGAWWVKEIVHGVTESWIWYIQSWSPLGWTGWISLQSKGLSRVFSNTTVQKHQFFNVQPSLWFNSHIHFSGGSDGKSVCLQCRRLGFTPWVGKIPWQRKGQPTPILLSGKFHGWRNLVGYSPWGRKESDTTERLHFHFSLSHIHTWLLEKP